MYLRFVSVIILLLAQLQNYGLVLAQLRKPAGMRRIQNARTRFQQRINRLGPNRIELIRTGRLGKNRGLPFGFVLLDGEVIDISNKIVQTRIQSGTAYYSFSDTFHRRPLYVRPGVESGWHFVVFQDPFYWRGSGHLILLKKVLGVNINRSKFQKDILYEAYTISLRVSMHPRVHIRDPVYQREIRNRKRKLGKVAVKRMRYQRFESPVHLRNLKGDFGKRKKRNVFTFPDTTLRKAGDCIMTPLNVTKMFLKAQKLYV